MSNYTADILDRAASDFVRAVEKDQDTNGASAVYLSRPLLVAVELAGTARTAAAAIRDDRGDDFGPDLDALIGRSAAHYANGHEAGWLAACRAFGLTPEDPDDPASYAEAQTFTGRRVRAVKDGPWWDAPDVLAILGQVAYQAYSASTGGRSAVSGAELPTWEGLATQATGATVRDGWIAAARAVAQRLRDSGPE